MRNKILWLSVFLSLTAWQAPVGTYAKHMQKRGVMDSFNEGIKFAGQMLGVNTAADVANLVAKAFSNVASATTTITISPTNSRNKPDFMQTLFQHQQQQQRQQTPEDSVETAQSQDQQYDDNADGNSTPAKEVVGVNFNSANFVTNVLRMIGFDASKLGALAINALIMIAQAIGNTLMAATKSKHLVSVSEGGRYQHGSPNSNSNDNNGYDTAHSAVDDHQPRHLDDDDADNDNRPLDWFLQSHDLMGRVLTHVVDAQLTDKLVDMIEQLETAPHEGACLKMLMCKSSPFIWGMQRSLNARYAPRNDSTRPQPQETVNRDDGSDLNAHSLFTDLPSVTEYRRHGSKCEQRYAQHCSKLQASKRKA